MEAPEEHPGIDLPRAIGRPATGGLLEAEIEALQKVSGHSEKELLALHGVGPKAIRILRDALDEQGLRFRTSGRW
ncbi:hypothetical protein [Nesterenkonia cremea]|uniref:DNA-binding protein n=1 Tax=Nesterenkonia cremea TaxID=1882340 RepID=A0A917APY8_9MICC|nr:hypothetical protein [Nesterenkonia cremea]GGE66884.1 hypothetical protein GCM10011401_12730 [Nesterenkonia cremea]